MFYCATPYRRLRPHLPNLAFIERVKAVLLVPVIRALGDVAKMLGYPAGWVWRLRNWGRPEVHWRKTAPEAKPGTRAAHLMRLSIDFPATAR